MDDSQPTPPGSEPLLSGVQRQAAELAGELQWAINKRWELARLELTIAALQIRRLTIGILIALILALAIVPVGVVLASELLAEATVLSRAAWLAIFGGALVVVSPGLAWLCWWRFRSRFTGLEATIDELREDLHWLDEYLPKSKRVNQ